MKKGLSQQMLLVIMIMLVLIVIFMTFLYTWKTTGTSYIDKSNCRNSVAGLIRMNQGPSEIFPPKKFIDSLKCTKEKVTLKPAEAQAQLAQVFKDAWFQFHEADQPLFKNNHDLCIITAEVTIEEPVTGFLNYIQTTPKRESTLKYLTNSRTSDTLQDWQDHNIDPSTSVISPGDYRVVFYYHQGSEEKDISTKFSTSHYTRYIGAQAKAAWIAAVALAPKGKTSGCTPFPEA